MSWGGRLSRYQPTYVQSLVYMLQASEYIPKEFYKWYRRTTDFTQVEHRKHLVMTTKARTLLSLGWLVVIGGLIGLRYVRSPWLFLAGLILLPYSVPYALLLSTWILGIIQRPVEGRSINKAQKILRSNKAFRIAIAGSFGKTSMREILKTVLSEGKKVASPADSINTPLGISQFVKYLDGTDEILIFELGEYYPGDIERLCDLVRPDMGIITGVNEAHLDKFKSLNQTRKTVFELADWLDDKPLFVNADSLGGEGYSEKGIGEWRVEGVHTDLRGTRFTLRKKERRIRVQSGLLGRHQVGPLAVAVAVADQLGLTDKQIEAGLAKTKPFEHRLQPSTDATGVTLLDDSYNGNPDGVRAVIEFLGSLSGRRWYITPGLVEMGSQSAAIHRKIGIQLAESGIERVILLRTSVAPYIEKGLQEGKFAGELLWFADMPEALAALPSLTVKGDIVLIQNDWPDQYS